MPGLIEILTGVPSGSYVESGVVMSGLPGGRYTVAINGVETDLQSTIPAEGLAPGARVIVNRTGAGRYIIGTTRQFTTQQSTEVIIDG